MTTPKRRKTVEGRILRGVEQLTCGFDGGITYAPTCGEPATLHVWAGTPPDTRGTWRAFACDQHAPILKPKAWDFHPIGGACGLPDAKWYSGSIQGVGLCRHDLDDDTLTTALAESGCQALVQAIHDRKLNR